MKSKVFFFEERRNFTILPQPNEILAFANFQVYFRIFTTAQIDFHKKEKITVENEKPRKQIAVSFFKDVLAIIEAFVLRFSVIIALMDVKTGEFSILFN